MCIDIDMILIEIVTHHFSEICTRVMALDLLQNFVSAQYLEDKLTDFRQFFSALILTRSSFRLLHDIYDLFVTELWPKIYVRISFLLNIFRPNGQNLTRLYKCIYIEKN